MGHREIFWQCKGRNPGTGTALKSLCINRWSESAMRGYPVPTCKKRNSTLCRMAWNPGEPIWKRLGDC